MTKILVNKYAQLESYGAWVVLVVNVGINANGRAGDKITIKANCRRLILTFDLGTLNRFL